MREIDTLRNIVGGQIRLMVMPDPHPEDTTTVTDTDTEEIDTDKITMNPSRKTTERITVLEIRRNGLVNDIDTTLATKEMNGKRKPPLPLPLPRPNPNPNLGRITRNGLEGIHLRTMMIFWTYVKWGSDRLVKMIICMYPPPPFHLPPDPAQDATRHGTWYDTVK